MNDSSVFRWSLCGVFLLFGEFYPKIKPLADIRKKVGEVWDNLRHGEKQPYDNASREL